MKILMINHFPLAGSGSGTYTRNLAVHLAALGHDVTVILPENSEDYERVEGVRLHPVFFTYRKPEDDKGKAGGQNGGRETEEDDKERTGATISSALPFNFPCFTTHPRSVAEFGDLSETELNMYLYAFRRAIEEEIGENRPDIIHGQHIWMLPAIAGGYGIPLVLTAHGTDLMGYEKWPELRRYAEQAINESARVISISQDNLDLLGDIFPDQKSKFVRKRNGYDPNVFYTEELDREEVLGRYGIGPEELKGRKIVCFAGKLTDFKGVDILLDAESIYGEGTGEDTLTLIVGDGEERDALKARAEKLGSKNVRFLGSVDQNELRRIYNVSDIDAVPSRREPFGLVAIEAMACGLPVVASDEGGLPDFVNDEVGALAKPEDPEDFAEKIREALKRLDDGDSFEWRKRISGYARENYAQDRIIRELEALYKEVLEDAKK